MVYNLVMDYSVRVKPGSKKGPLVEVDGQGTLMVYVRQRAVDGQANEAVVEVLAGHFGVAKSRVAIMRGQASRIKMVRIED